MRRMQMKMGKYAIKNSSLGNTNHHEKRLSRDSCLDESNDSGLGPDFHINLPDSSSSSCLEESDIDSSSDSVDSGISCRNRRLIKAKPRSSTSLVANSNQSTLYSPYSVMHIENSLSLSLNHKMHIHQKPTDGRDLICHNEPPPAKRRKLLPLLNPQDEKPRRSTVHHYPTMASATAGVLTEAPICVNSIGRNTYQEPLLIDLPRDSASYKGTPDYSSRSGDHIAALLSPNSHALSRKRSTKKPSLHQPFPHISKDGKTELRILVQPEEQHRARYMTEGSRGSIKDEKGTGFPTIKLIGYQQPVLLQIFIGCDQGKVQPHLFYQACKVTGKNCTPCMERLIDGTCVIEIQLDPSTDMTVSCDCIGILKERNVDVEQRLPYFGLSRCKKRSTKCRMVFRVNIPLSSGTYETLQITSSPILCTQSPGLPEICKKSITECSVKGGTDLFIIGKNFQKDARIVFTELARDQADQMVGGSVVWEESVEPEKEYVHQSHLVCCVPPYRDQEVHKAVKVMLSVSSGGKSSEPHIFTYTPIKAVPKEEFDNLNFEMQPRIHTVPVEIKQEWNGDSATSDGVSNSVPNMMGSVASMIQPVVGDPPQDSHSPCHSSPSSLISLSMPPLQHLVANSSVGSLMMNSNSTIVNPISLPQLEEQQSHPSSTYTMASHSEHETATKVVEESHHDVDLISGINQLATEIVNEQQRRRLTTEQACIMSGLECNSSSNLSSLGSSSTSFSGDNCFSASSSAIKHEDVALSSYCSKIDLSNNCIGSDNNLFLSASASGSSSMCSASLELNSDTKVANSLYTNSSDELSQKSSMTNYMMNTTIDAHPSSLSESNISMVNSVPEAVGMPNLSEVEYGPVADPLMLPADKLSSAVGSCPNIRLAVVSENAMIPPTPRVIESQGGGSLPLVMIKSEKVEMPAAMPGAGQNHDMSGFQQSMTFALSQLSDADLLSMINPNTFDSV